MCSSKLDFVLHVWKKARPGFTRKSGAYQEENGQLLVENNNLHCKTSEKEQKYGKEIVRKKKIQAKEFHQFIVYLQYHNGHKSIISKSYPAVGNIKALECRSWKPKVQKLWESSAQANDLEVFNMVEIMEKRSAKLLGELEELKLDNHHQSEIIAALKCQVNQKEKEIERLHHLMEGRRSPTSWENCSQCKHKDGKIKSLEGRLEEAVAKQHEAMSRALHLAERNQRLERELKDIDNMALAVEEECQNKVKQNLRNMEILQDKLKQKIDEIKKLEETVTDLKIKIERDGHEMENLRTEKKLLEKNLNLENKEKKNLHEKVNHFLLVEKNLKSEISRLQEINKNLQRQIGDMEEKVMDVLGTSCKPKGRQKKQSHSSGILSTKTDLSSSASARYMMGDEKKCNSDERSCGDCIHAKSRDNILEKVQQERDFYHNECHRLKDIISSFHARFEKGPDAMRQFEEQEREMKGLKEELYTLRRENCLLLKKLEGIDHMSCSSGDSIKIILDRLEKERDMALSDISRLQGERDALKEKIKYARESQLGVQSRLEGIVVENEGRIRRLESERRELISNQSSQRIALANMEEKCEEYKEQVRNAQAELGQMTANYAQLKTLQEQTDRTLSEIQGRLSQSGMELRFATNKIKELETEKEELLNEISALKKERSSLKSSLTFMEKEKDSLLITLDEKTEKVAKLENEIKKQETYISELREKISHLEKKFEFTLNEKTSREHGLRALERNVERLKEELEQCERQKEALIRENRRLQDDLASAAKDCLTARRSLDSEKQEVENLKRQLQQYVSEVKRAEELLTKKESERNQMLDHFRSLSLEATALESNNHTLESTVENTKTELMTANNKIMDLEHQISSKDSLLYSYEKQIAELTTQIAELETKLKQQTELKNRAEGDLSALRDLCSAIDSQKEALRRQASTHDAEKTQLINEVRRLSEEYEGLNEKLSYEKSVSQTLEKSLSNSRQETLEHKINNKDLQTHVQHLREKVDELTRKLESESKDVRRYQSQCAELSQQVSELRREVTNARFEQAKAAEDSKRLEYAVTPESEDEYSCSLAGSLPTSSRTFVQSTGEQKRRPFASPTKSYPAVDSSNEHSLPASRFPNTQRSLDFLLKPRDLYTRNFPPTTDDEEAKEIRFEMETLESSARNIPPLTFPEDSDRTVSLDLDGECLKFYTEEPGNTFRKFDWKLSPLIEKSSCGSKADTTSEMSSLPEDSEPRNGKLTMSSSEDKLTGSSSVYPTYSVHGGSDSQSGTYVIRESEGFVPGEGLATSRGGGCCFLGEDFFAEIATSEDQTEEKGSVVVSSPSEPGLMHSGVISLSESCEFQSCD